jgi:hypothetical protein
MILRIGPSREWVKEAISGQQSAISYRQLAIGSWQLATDEEPSAISYLPSAIRDPLIVEEFPTYGECGESAGGFGRRCPPGLLADRPFRGYNWPSSRPPRLMTWPIANSHAARTK